MSMPNAESPTHWSSVRRAWKPGASGANAPTEVATACRKPLAASMKTPAEKPSSWVSRLWHQMSLFRSWYAAT